MKSILIVGGDAGSASVTMPVARHLKEHGHNIIVVAERKAGEVFRRNGVEPLIAMPDCVDNGSVDFRLLLDYIRPETVITGLSFPINLEKEVGGCAQQMGIPLTIIEDVPGASMRVPRYASLVFAADSFGQEIARTHHPDAKIVWAGNPGVRSVIPSEEMVKTVARLRGTENRKVYVFSESTGPNSDAVEQQIAQLAACARITTGSFCIVPRLHPKWKNLKMGDGTSAHALWTKMLMDSIPMIEVVEEGSTDELAVLADGVISVFSILLTIAVHNGGVGISLRTPASVAFMEESTGFSTLPLVTLGCATEVSEPCDLSLITPPEPWELAQLQPYDPELVVDQIERFLAARS